MRIKVDVIPTVNEIRNDQIIGKTVIIIDVLRASTTIVTALMSGCGEIIPVETMGQAFPLKNEHTVLAGERYCKKIAGFDFSNSPTELCNSQLLGKNLVLSTTNGTNAIQKAAKGELVLIGSFLNGPAVASIAMNSHRDITLLCAGTRNQFALEDALCAGYIISHLQFTNPIECSDLAWMTYTSYQYTKDDISLILPVTTTGNRLFELGLVADIQHCAQKNITDIVPYLKDHRIIVHPLS